MASTEGSFDMPGAPMNSGNPVKTPVDASVLSRIVRGARYILTGNQEAWLGPGQPLAPIADNPSQMTRGRIFNFSPQYNTNTKPKRGEGSTFDDLRGLADNYDLVRLAIETRKNQMASQQIDFAFRDKTKKGDDDRIVMLREFFRYPDKMNDWETWLRMLLEDMLVIDAATIYPRLTRGGELYSLDPIDGATVNRVLDGYGRTPMAPDPAYQQIFNGMPAVDYTYDELIYRPRNLRTNRVYGFSPTEQVVTTINIALRRQLHQLQYYTEGNLPDSLFTTPETWTPDDVRQFQEWWDSTTTGQVKSKGRFLPDGVTVIDTKQAAFGKDDQVMNEWLARIVCYCFDVSPTQLTITNNRATSDTQKETSESEGLAPTKQWVKNLIDFIVSKYFGFDDIELKYVDPNVIDPMVKAQVDKLYVDMGALDPEEVRSELGHDPFTDEQRERMAANKAPAFPFGSDPGAAQGTPPASDGVVAQGAPNAAGGEQPLKEPKPKDDQPVIGKLEIHMGDTLVEMAPTTIKANFSNGRVSEARIEPDGR